MEYALIHLVRFIVNVVMVTKLSIKVCYVLIMMNAFEMKTNVNSTATIALEVIHVPVKLVTV